MSDRQNWSLIKSLSCAVQGIAVAFRDERNMRIHGALTIIVLGVMVWLRVSEAEALVLVLNITLVWVAELFNSALEESFDLQMKAQHPQVKVGKDVAAGAVLIASISAGITGSIIFLPKLWNLL